MLIEASPPSTGDSMHSTNNNDSVKRWVDNRANFVSMIFFSVRKLRKSIFQALRLSEMSHRDKQSLASRPQEARCLEAKLNQ